MSTDRSGEAEKLFARASRGLSRDRLKRAAADFRTPAGERLSERDRAQTLHILNDLFDEVEASLRRSLAISLATLGASGRAAAVDLGRGVPGFVWPLVQAGVMAPPFDLLNDAMTRAAEHALTVALRSPASAGDALSKCLAKTPDAELSQRMMNFVVADSRRLDRFGEPRLPFDMLSETLASKVAWLAAAGLRRYLAQYPVDETALDEAVESAVRQLLAERIESGAMRHAARLAARLDSLDLLDADLLSALAAEGHIALLAAALARLAGIVPDVVLELLLNNEPGTLILLRALDLPKGAMRSITAAIAIHRDDPTPVKERVKQAEAISLADARQLLAVWRRDSRYADAIAALE